MRNFQGIVFIWTQTYFKIFKFCISVPSRAKLRNKLLKNRSNKNKTNYVKQRNHCVSLLKKMKREYYSHLGEENICDNETFWKIVKPISSKKIKSNERITLIENDEIIKRNYKSFKRFLFEYCPKPRHSAIKCGWSYCENIDIETIQVLLHLRNSAILNLIFHLKMFKGKKFLKN